MQTPAVAPATDYDVDAVRADFPALHQELYEGRPLVYLDNAASAQKPRAVIERVAHYYRKEHSNVHRGVHFLSQQASEAYEAARATAARFIHAPDPKQVIFTRGTTESINLVAATYGRQHVGEGDEIVVSMMEHHSNIVPWQLLCAEVGARLCVIPVNERGELDFEAFEAMLNERTKFVAVVHVSNALGTINPARRIVEAAHARGIPVLLDGAQAAPHAQIDVQALDADFYCLSGHKMFGPTGIGLLYGRLDLLEAMPPYQGGGDMIEHVSFDGTTFNELPHKFEAGTPHIAGAVGLAAACDYLDGIGLDRIAQYEHALLDYATARLTEIDGVRLVGTAAEKASVLSFLIDGVHPYDAGTILDRLGIAVRTGHHCTQPLMQHLGLPGTIRASFALYNTRDEADRLADGVRRVQQMFAT